eukprot:scaffold6067_cov112-Isochrysis_galbana.AAC.3
MQCGACAHRYRPTGFPVADVERRASERRAKYVLGKQRRRGLRYGGANPRTTTSTTARALGLPSRVAG